MAVVGYTYDDKAVREDLLDLITNLTPRETQLVAGLGSSTAKSTLHEWLTDTLSAVKANAYAEGADASYQTLTNPARLTNVTQISRQAFQVSGTERAVDQAGFNDRMAYEAEKAMDILKNDIELALMNGALTQSVVSTNTARALRGVKASLSLASVQSGISLTEAIFNDYLQLVWDNSRQEVDEVYGDMYMKRKISGFTAGSTKNTNNSDKRLVNSVDVYEADAAKMVKLFAHRYVNLSGSGSAVTNHSLVGIKNDKFRTAWLRKPFMTDLAKTGDSDKAEIISEYTLECIDPTAGFHATEHL
jgi:hypothetical protein